MGKLSNWFFEGITEPQKDQKEKKPEGEERRGKKRKEDGKKMGRRWEEMRMILENQETEQEVESVW